MDTGRNDLLGEIAADAALERSDFLVQSADQLRRFLDRHRERIAAYGGLTLIDEEPDYLSIAPDSTFRSRTRFLDDLTGDWVSETEVIEHTSGRRDDDAGAALQRPEGHVLAAVGGHQDDQRVDGRCESGPVHRLTRLVVSLVSRHHRERGGHPAMGDWYTRVRRHGDGRRGERRAQRSGSLDQRTLWCREAGGRGRNCWRRAGQ